MLLKTLGWFFIITGILFLFKPERVRSGLKKKSVKELKNLFFGLDLILGILLVAAAWGIPGALAKILVLCGVTGIGKAFFLLKAKAADSLVQWLIDQPRKYFRMFAVGQIIFGAVILSA